MTLTPATGRPGGGIGGAVDVTDRAGRLLGHVTVDNATLAVTGPLTDTELRASPVPVSASIVGTVPISAAALPLPDGAATEATAERAADTLDDVGLTAILEREKLDP